MAWTYESIVVPTDTVTRNVFGTATTYKSDSMRTASGSATALTISATTFGSGGTAVTKDFFGTGWGYYTFTDETDITTTTDTGTIETTTETTVTSFQSWAVETQLISQTLSATVSSIELSKVPFSDGPDTSSRSFWATSSSTRYTSSDIRLGGTHGVTVSMSSLLTTSESLVGFSQPSGTRGTTTGSGTASSTSSLTLRWASDSWTYNSGTATFSDTVTSTLSTDSAETFTYLSTTTSGTSTVTSTFAAVNPDTSTTTSTFTSSGTSILTGSFDYLAIKDTIIHADSTDWVWTTSDTGASIVSAIGDSITDTTISQQAFGISTSWVTSSASYTTSSGMSGGVADTTSFVNSVTFVVAASTAAEIRTTSSSTYAIGQSANGAFIPLTDTTAATRTFTTTSTSSVDYEATDSISFSFVAPLWSTAVTALSTESGTIISSSTGDLNTYTTTYTSFSGVRDNAPDLFRQSASFSSSSSNTNNTFSTSSSSEVGSSATVELRLDRSSYDLNQNTTASFAPDTIRVLEPHVAGGFQAWPVSFGGSYGTNLSGGDLIQIPSWGLAFRSVILPLMDNSTHSYASGATSYTSQYVASESRVHVTSQFTGAAVTGSFSIAVLGSADNDKYSSNSTASTIGGYGWFRGVTDGSTLSAYRGVHSYTVYDSDLVSNTGILSWDAASSTISLGVGERANFETVPAVSIARSEASSEPQISVTWEAFPES